MLIGERRRGMERLVFLGIATTILAGVCLVIASTELASGTADL